MAFALVLGAIAGGTQGAGQELCCDQFKWSVARERGWFAAGARPAASGATIVAEQGYAVTLQPSEAVAFRVKPERAPKPGSFGAALNVADIAKSPT